MFGRIFGYHVIKGFIELGVEDMDAFKIAMKNEIAKEKSKGNLEEKQSDAMSFDLFSYMCEAAIAAGDYF